MVRINKELDEDLWNEFRKAIKARNGGKIKGFVIPSLEEAIGDWIEKTNVFDEPSRLTDRVNLESIRRSGQEARQLTDEELIERLGVDESVG